MVHKMLQHTTPQFSKSASNISPSLKFDFLMRKRLTVSEEWLIKNKLRTLSTKTSICHKNMLIKMSLDITTSWKLTLFLSICSPKTVLLRTENEGSQMSLHVFIPNRGYYFNNSIFGKAL